MDQKLTNRLQAWLDTPAAKRSIEEGRLLVLQLIGNRILANNFQRLPGRYMSHVEYQLRKFLTVRIAKATHEDVEAMTKQVNRIAVARHLQRPLPGKRTEPEEKRIAKTEPFRKGKRPDHDQLPEEIRACYAENLSIMQQMRSLHERLLILTEQIDEGSPNYCPDGDRYPFVKEIIDLDDRYMKNWQKYDAYVAE